MSTPLAVGTAVADFSRPSTAGTFTLSEQAGKTVVLYFYPKDSTPGCTTEAANFRDLHDQFVAANAVIVGVSRDSLKSHQNFKDKLGFPFDLITDADEQLCSQFSVIKMKNMYGKQVRGIERSTFIIDRHGVLQHEWRGVKVAGHVDEVLKLVQAMQTA